MGPADLPALTTKPATIAFVAVTKSISSWLHPYLMWVQQQRPLKLDKHINTSST
jgi:hypothetical protein